MPRLIDPSKYDPATDSPTDSPLRQMESVIRDMHLRGAPESQLAAAEIVKLKMRDWLSRGRVGDPPIYVARNEPQEQKPANVPAPKPDVKVVQRAAPKPVTAMFTVEGESITVTVNPSDRIAETVDDVQSLFRNLVDASLILRENSPHCSAARIEIQRSIARLKECGAIAEDAR